MGTKWTEEHRKNFIAAMAKRRQQREAKRLKHKPLKERASINHHDAVIYLRHAKRAMMKQMRDGTIKDLDSTQLYMLLALNSLQEQDE